MSTDEDLYGWANRETRDFWRWLNCRRDNKPTIKSIAFMISGGCDPDTINRCIGENYRLGLLPGVDAYVGNDPDWVGRVDWPAVCDEIKDLVCGRIKGLYSSPWRLPRETGSI